MGRPLNHKFFGDLNPDNVGGEGVASVTVGGTNNSSGYTTGDAVTFTTPQIAGGTSPAGTVNAFANGLIGNITITLSGSGYTSAPTAYANTGTLGTTTLTSVLTSGTSARRNVIMPQVRIGGTNRTSGNDILSQKSTRRYRVKSQDGTGICTLVARTPANALEMAIVATDSQSNTYWVRKITKNKVELVQNTLVGATWDINDGDTAKWTITGSAAAPVAGGNPAQLDGPTVVDIGTVVLNNA
jgi:hypothetical protein